MRGPISTCFLTCSIASSPLNTAAPGTTAGLASVVRSEVATRELGGASFFGQPANTSEKDKEKKAIISFFFRPRKRKPIVSQLASTASYTVIEANAKTSESYY